MVWVRIGMGMGAEVGMGAGMGMGTGARMGMGTVARMEMGTGARMGMGTGAGGGMVMGYGWRKKRSRCGDGDGNWKREGQGMETKMKMEMGTRGWECGWGYGCGWGWEPPPRATGRSPHVGGRAHARGVPTLVRSRSGAWRCAAGPDDYGRGHGAESRVGMRLLRINSTAPCSGGAESRGDCHSPTSPPAQWLRGHIGTSLLGFWQHLFGAIASNGTCN